MKPHGVPALQRRSRGAAEAIRQRIGMVRIVIHQASYETSAAALRDAMGEKDFDTA